jgi:hypothetical protein
MTCSAFGKFLSKINGVICDGWRLRRSELIRHAGVFILEEVTPDPAAAADDDVDVL